MLICGDRSSKTQAMQIPVPQKRASASMPKGVFYILWQETLLDYWD